jgi:hypothetical protein
VKIIEKDILPFQEDDYFSPIRDKIAYARIVVLSARNLQLEYDSAGMEIGSKMRLVIDQMSRLFFYKAEKYYSIAFPFVTLIAEDRIVEITTYSGKKVDFQSISAVISIIENEQFKLNPSPIDHYIESIGIESIGFSLLEEILQFEPSYIRYDHDPVRQNGKMHPLHHLDINYSQYGTFKIGLNNRIESEYFENLQNTNTECSYLID